MAIGIDILTGDGIAEIDISYFRIIGCCGFDLLFRAMRYLLDADEVPFHFGFPEPLLFEARSIDILVLLVHEADAHPTIGECFLDAETDVGSPVHHAIRSERECHLAFRLLPYFLDHIRRKSPLIGFSDNLHDPDGSTDRSEDLLKILVCLS